MVADPASRAYLSVFLLIAGDAVIPIFPGETTLNAASLLAAQGTLSLPLVIAYWIGSALDDYPLGSVVISGVVTTVIMGLAFFGGRHRAAPPRSQKTRRPA